MARSRQTQQTTEQTAAAYVPIRHDTGSRVGFPGGTMSVDGVRQTPVRVWHPISSNGITRYDTVEWIHPTTGELRLSCNCPRWVRLVGTTRTCKHVEEMATNPLLGQSPEESQRTSDGFGEIRTPTPPAPTIQTDDSGRAFRRLDT